MGYRSMKGSTVVVCRLFGGNLFKVFPIVRGTALRFWRRRYVRVMVKSMMTVAPPPPMRLPMRIVRVPLPDIHNI